MTDAMADSTVTFLFTDIEGSTRLWAEHGEVMGQAVARHDALLRAAVREHGGTVFKTVGDAVCAVFPAPQGALSAALAGQKSLTTATWGDVPPPSVRMAIHTGVAEHRDGDWFGQTVNRVARVLGVGHGGQVLLSRAAQELVADHLPNGVSLRDLGEHRLKDLSRPERVFQAVAPDLRADFPPLNSVDARASNLPLLPHPLLGREEEVANLQALLTAGEARLVTLTGPGGTGKTRLAMQVGAELLDAFPDGVFVVDLAPLADARLVPAVVATTLGLVENSGETVTQTLTAWLRHKRLLLMLDNFEQILPAAAFVSDILGACPGIRVLATSRAPLRLSWEHEMQLEPMPVPSAPGTAHVKDLTRYAAVQLFVDRAAAVRPDFRVTRDNAAIIAEICARLDGLPLAIELAAARIRVLPPSAILARLDQSLLAGGARDRPERQQTMRAAIAWSYDLLEPECQRLFRRLAVFAGGFTLEAAEAVCDPDGSQLVLAGLTELVEQSLVRLESEAATEPRYSQLETLRSFGLGELAEADELDCLRDHHLAWCHALGSEAAGELEGPLQPQWHDRIQREMDNVRAALDWSLESGQPALGLHIAGYLSHYWYQRCQTAEARQVLESLLAATGDLAPGPVRARAWRTLGVVCMSQGAAADAGSCFEAASAAAETPDDRGRVDDAELARCLAQHTWQAWAIGDADLAGRLWRRAVERAGTAPRLWDRALVAMVGCMVADVEGDLARAAQLSHQSLADFRSAGDPYYTAVALNNHGWDRMLQGEADAAIAALMDGCELAEASGYVVALACCLESLGRAAREAGDLGLARRSIGESLSLAQQHGLHSEVADCLEHLAAVEMMDGHAELAAVLLGAQEAVLREQGRSLGAGEPARARAGLLDEIAGSLDDVGREAATRRGQSLTVDEAVALGLRVTGRDGGLEAGRA